MQRGAEGIYRVLKQCSWNVILGPLRLYNSRHIEWHIAKVNDFLGGFGVLGFVATKISWCLRIPD